MEVKGVSWLWRRGNAAPDNRTLTETNRRGALQSDGSSDCDAAAMPLPSSYTSIMLEPDAFSMRVNKLAKWAREYIHQVDTFVGAEEVQELTFLRDQRQQLIKLVGELKAENRRLRKRVTIAHGVLRDDRETSH